MSLFQLARPNAALLLCGRFYGFRETCVLVPGNIIGTTQKVGTARGLIGGVFGYVSALLKISAKGFPYHDQLWFSNFNFKKENYIMYILNRAIVIGRLKKNPDVFWVSAQESIATFTLLTPIAGSKIEQQHQVIVEDPLQVEYAVSCLVEGNLVFVEGELEQVGSATPPSQTSWILISKTFGGLHPIASHVHDFEKSA